MANVHLYKKKLEMLSSSQINLCPPKITDVANTNARIITQESSASNFQAAQTTPQSRSYLHGKIFPSDYRASSNPLTQKIPVFVDKIKDLLKAYRKNISKNLESFRNELIDSKAPASAIGDMKIAFEDAVKKLKYSVSEMSSTYPYKSD